MATSDQKSLDTIKAQISGIQEKIKSSPTYAKGVDPSSSDLFADTQLRTLQKSRQELQGKIAKEKWYGTDAPAEEESGNRPVGILEKVLNAAQRPLYGIVGAAEALTGKGSVPGFANIEANMNEGEAFGSLLRKLNVPNGIAGPAGFGLDIALDPLNWLTGGSSTFVGGVGKGLIEKGLVGAAKGVEKGVLEKAAGATRLIPGFKKEKAFISELGKTGKTIADLSKEEKAAMGFSKLYEGVAKVQEKAFQSGEEYKAMLGNTLENVLADREMLAKTVGETGLKNTIKGTYLNAGDLIRGTVGKLPYGEQLLTAFDHNPEHWFKIQQLRDKLFQIEKEKGNVLGETIDPLTGAINRVGVEDIHAATGPAQNVPTMSNIKNETQDILGNNIGTNKVIDTIPGTESIPSEATAASKIDASNPQFIDKVDNAPLQSIDDVVADAPMGEKVKTAPAESLGKVVQEGEEAAYARPTITRSEDPIERAQRLLGEAGVEYDFKDLMQAVVKNEEQKTGIKIYDEAVKGWREIKKINGAKDKMIKALDSYMVFVNLFKAMKVSMLSPSAVLNSAVGNAVMGAMVGFDITRPSYIRNIKNSAKLLLGRDSTKYLEDTLYKTPGMIEWVTGNPNAFGGIFGMTSEDLLKTEEITRVIGAAQRSKGAIPLTAEEEASAMARAGSGAWSRGTATEKVAKDFAEGKYSESNIPISLAAQEFGGDRGFLMMKKKVAEKAAAGNPVAMTLNWLVTKPVSGLEKFDQSYKLGGFMQMAVDGMTEEELLKISRFIKMGPNDIASKFKSQGRFLYRLTPAKAAEVVADTYMNYAAMPGIVKVLRTLPILGHPFASFTYGMMGKAAQTAMYNPSLFNKIGFLMNEINGDQTPLEKEALKSKYYSRFGQPGMLKLNIFKDNPMYINLTNQIPYLSLNMLNPSERKYGNTMPDAIMSAIDKFPILKDPGGQLLVDYFIQPMVLQGEAPQNQFGSRLYPADATPLKKTLYAGKQLIEAVLPPVMSYGGLLTPHATTDQLEFAPYRWANISHAMQGEDIHGAPVKEDPMARTVRQVAAGLGISMSPVNLDYVASSLKDKTKK